MIEYRADMHCHSTCSDGTSSPQEIIQMALQMGLSGLLLPTMIRLKLMMQLFP